MKNTGVRSLAKKAGVSPSLVSRKKRQGKSDEQIVAEAKYRNGKAPMGGSESYFEAQARKETALASIRELELAQKRGDVLDRKEAQQEWAAMVATAKSRLLVIDGEIGHDLAVETDPTKCSEIVDGKIYEALVSLAGYE